MARKSNLTKIPKLKVLILEDLLYDAKLIEHELRSVATKRKVKIEKSAKGLKVALQEFKPDLIISDYYMPLLNGEEALAIAQAIAPDTPFIFVTGTLENEELAAQTILDGASGFVLKNNLHRLPTVILGIMRSSKLLESNKDPKKKQLSEDIAKCWRDAMSAQKSVEEIRENLQKILEKVY